MTIAKSKLLLAAKSIADEGKVLNQQHWCSKPNISFISAKNNCQENLSVEGGRKVPATQEFCHVQVSISFACHRKDGIGENVKYHEIFDEYDTVVISFCFVPSLMEKNAAICSCPLKSPFKKTGFA